MTNTTETRQRLQAAFVKVTRSIKQVRDKGEHIGETQTKTSLIAPVLASLGWDTTDLEEVSLEYRHKPKDNPVDYAFFLPRKACLFIEAKALDTNLDDHKWQSQVVNYANAAGVEWCVLTDGDRYCIYNSHAPVDVDRKLFRSVAISDTAKADYTLDTLELLSKVKLSDNLISVLWTAQFIDRQVQVALDEIFEGEHRGLVNLIRKRTPELKPAEIRDSLKRAKVIVDFPELPPGGPTDGGDPERGEYQPQTDAEWGVRSFGEPLLIDGKTIVLNKYRKFLKTTRAVRVSLNHIRRTAEAAYAIAQAGNMISLPAIRTHPGGPPSGYPTQRALGALYLAGAILFAEGQHTDYFRIADNLTAEGMAERVLAKAQRTAPAERSQTDRPATGTKQQFKWVLEMDEDGAFVMDCRYLPDESKSFQVRGKRVPAHSDFKPARKKLSDEIYQQIKPLFPDLPDGRIRAKAWSGVHKVYPASTYGNR